MNTNKPLTVKCPTCQKTITWNEQEPFRPFCSERCKLIDLGEWATEEKKIPGEPAYIPNEDEPDSFFH
ncbi:DNA gyrase inhibitor YacG [Methylomarinum vadi]|uniref:DNA gyrase inhibitor YacG n=1 Tax=Methylomarinum vadi TaxID=438855 RepID=UPI0004DF3950|nr:DNA gyrase inhibitor YacG [Methylomarinum vadi]